MEQADHCALGGIPHPDRFACGPQLLILHATVAEFRTDWFVESVISAALIVLVVRTRRPCFKSRPSPYLLAATLGVVVVTLLLPYSPLNQLLGFTPLPLAFLLMLVGIIALYVFMAELAKKLFYRYVVL